MQKSRMEGSTYNQKSLHTIFQDTLYNKKDSESTIRVN